MRPDRRPFRSLLAFVALAALVAAALPAGAAGEGEGPVPITFSHGNVVDIQRLAGEPELKSDSKGNLYVTGPIGVQYAHSFLWKSEDRGDSFDLLRAFPPMQRPMASLGSGDAATAIVPGPPGTSEDAVVWSDMVNLAGLANAATFDGGNSFPPDHWNLYASDPGADRQWLTGLRLPGTTTDRVYQVYNETPIGGLSVIYSDDYGKSWTVGQRNIDGFSSVGNVAADPVHERVYIGYASGSAAMVAGAGLDATGFEPQVAGFGQGSVNNLFVSVDVDTAGNVYAAYTESQGARATYLAVSADQGQTWTQTRMSPPEQKATVFPWVVAGDPGRAWVVWYGSEANGAPPSNRGPWHLYGAQTLDALSTQPRAEVVRISEHAMHDNEICLSGLACTVGQAEDRNLLDDFTADIDPEGMLHVAYNDTNNQLREPTINRDPDAGGAFVIHVRQESGPSLYEDSGVVAPVPAAPSVSAVSVEGGVVTLEGTHALPPKNFGEDEAGDAAFPRHHPDGPGPSEPTLDVEGVVFDASEDNLLITLDIVDHPDPVATGGRKPLHVVSFWHSGQVYFVATEGLGVAYHGTPGIVPNQAGIAKLATYQQDPTRTTTALHGTQPLGEIQLTVPLADIGNPAPGTRFDQITATAFVANGSEGSEALMDAIDSTPAASWALGDAPARDGAVQISVDDPSFANPVIASLDGTSNAWSAALESLEAGHHTIYVREVARGLFPGDAATIDVTV